VTESSLTDLEGEIRRALAAPELERCATLVLKGYGPEILGYLLGRLRDETLASESFAMFAEDLWRSLPGLTLSATMRAYAYALARNAASRLLGRQLKKERKGVPLSDAEVWSRVAHQVREDTLPHLQTAMKSKVAALRAQLSEEEQTLLTLRVDRELSWPEIAVVYADGKALDKQELLREAAKLRKRFEVTKQRLRKLAAAAGVLPADPKSDE
jgi:RNA polymerase sigma-70 factor, ECF subfamily